MGKLSITGKAEREVSYNAVEISVTFYIHAKTTAEALQIVMEQSEKFLELVTAAGVAAGSCKIRSDSRIGRACSGYGILGNVRQRSFNSDVEIGRAHV